MDPWLQRHCGITDLEAWRRLVPEAAVAALPIQVSLAEAFALPLLARLRLRVDQGVRPILGLNGPVGAGKTSLGRALLQLAPRFGLELGVASIDDFYLPWPQRQQAMAGNPFGVSRVPPGSHDLPLLDESLGRWAAGEPWTLPRFDKRLRRGEGDRAGERTVACEAVVLEGWLLGCGCLGPEALQQAVLAVHGGDAPGAPTLTAEERTWLPHWDRALEAYQPLWRRFEELWLLRPMRWDLPRRWRFQAEARQRRSMEGQGQGWLNGEALDRLVRASLCSLPPQLYQEPLAHQSGTVTALLDGRRRCLQCTVGAEPGAAQSSDSSSLSMG